MANPQPDQFTRISNELLEAYSHIRLSGEEGKVFWVIVRQTYGFHKKMDAIALDQFVVKTGLKKPNVCRALSKLITKNMIIKDDNTQIISYGIQKDYSLWYGLSKPIKIIKTDNSDYQKRSKSLSKKIHTKEKKETITKEKYIDCVFLSQNEYTKLIEKYGEQTTYDAIEYLNNYKMSKGKRYKSDYHTILRWVIKAIEERRGGIKPRGGVQDA